MSKEWVDAIVKIGLPGALVVFFVWWSTGKIDRSMSQFYDQHATFAAEHQTLIRDSAQIIGINAEISRTLRAMCVNAAETAEERLRCFSAGEK